MRTARKWILGASLLSLPFLLFLGLHWKARADLRSYKNQLIRSGEKLTIAELIPQHPTNAVNWSVLSAKARSITSLNSDHFPPGMRMVAPGKGQVQSKEDEILEYPFKTRTNLWALIEGPMENARSALEELRPLLQAEQFAGNLRYHEGFRMSFGTYLMDQKRLAQALSAYVLLDLHKGNSESALENLTALLHLVRGTGNEPLMISHLVRIAIGQIAMGVTWEALQYDGWCDDQLQRIQGAWGAIEFEGMEEVLGMERAMGTQMMAECRAAGTKPDVLFGTGGNRFEEAFTELSGNNYEQAWQALVRPPQWVWNWVLSYREEQELLAMWQIGIDASRTIEKARTLQPHLDQLENAIMDFKMTDPESMLTGSQALVFKAWAKVGNTRIAQSLCATASALGRYRLANKTYPERLASLVPKYLATIPIDPSDGQPLRYRKQGEDSFLLYSVGVDGIDQGGNAAHEGKKMGFTGFHHPSRGQDWVWPQPATAEEILLWEKIQRLKSHLPPPLL